MSHCLVAFMLWTSVGEVDVDIKTGAAQWSYSLELPPGRNGHTPRITIQYDSNAGLSSFGYGFTLLEPAIRRSAERGVPSYDDADEFLFDGGSGGGGPLVPIAPFAGGTEYRLLDDDADMRFIRIDGHPSTWLLQSRDGSVQYFEQAVAAAVPSATSADSSVVGAILWKRTKWRDAQGNVIEYEYTPAPGAGSASLTRVVWGGNDTVNQAHVFEAHLLRENGANPFPEIQAQFQRPRIACKLNRGDLSNYRYGVNFPEDLGEMMHLTWGAVITTAAPGVATPTTTPTPFERQRRISSVYQFTYNWDRVGCEDYDNLWPLLENVDLFGFDLAGNVTRAPTISLLYNSWERAFAAHEGPDLPAGFQLNEAVRIDPDMSPYLALSAPNFDRELGLYHESGRACRIDDTEFWSTFGAAAVWMASWIPGIGEVIAKSISMGMQLIEQDLWLESCRYNDLAGSALMAMPLDVRGDGTWEFVDMQECLAPSGRGPASFGLEPWAYPGASILQTGVAFADNGISDACGIGIPIRMAKQESAPGARVRLPSFGSYNYVGDLLFNSIEPSQYRKTDSLLVDLDGDGDKDLVRAGRWYRFDHLTQSFDGGTDLPRAPWSGLDYVWRHSPIDRGELRWSGDFGSAESMRLIQDRRFSPMLQDGSQALALTQSYGHTSTPVTVSPFSVSVGVDFVPLASYTGTEEEIGTGVAWSSSVGDVRDYDGDGIPDRLATLRNGEWVELALYRGMGDGTFGPPRRMYRQHRDELDWAGGEMLPPSAQTSVTVGVARTPNSRTIPVFGDIETDAAVDINSDGLVDLLSGGAHVSYRSHKSSVAGGGIDINLGALARGSLGSVVSARITAGDITVRSGSLNLESNGLRALRNTGKRFMQDSLRGWVSNQSLVSLTSFIRERPFEVGDSRHCTSLSRVDCLRRWGTLRVEKRGTLADYNGDGFVDLVYPTFWRPNIGGDFGEPLALPSAPTLYDGFMDVSLTDSRQAFTAKKQMLIDVDGDGRIDVLGVERRAPLRSRLVRFGDSAKSYVYRSYFPTRTTIDTIAGPPGRLIQIGRGLGSTTRITYRHLASQRETEQASEVGAVRPRQGWVVTRVETSNAPYAQTQTKTYRYVDEQYVSDRLRPGSRERFAGYARSEVCDEETGILTKTYFDYAQNPRGLVHEIETWVDPKDLGTNQQLVWANEERSAVELRPVSTVKSCGAATELMKEVHQTHSVVDVPAAGGRTYRRTLLSTTLTHSYLFDSTLDSPSVRRMAMPLTTQLRREYEPGTSLLRYMHDDADITRSNDDTVTAFDYEVHAEPERYVALLLERSLTSASEGLVGLTRTVYDGHGRASEVSVSASPTEAYVTRFAYDALGNASGIISPSGRVERRCYDRFKLYPVRVQGHDMGQVQRVFDYATGQTLQTQGPVGLSTELLVCDGDAAEEPSFTPRRTDPIPLEPPKWQPPRDRRVSVPHVTNFGGQGVSSSDPNVTEPPFTEHPHSTGRLPGVTDEAPAPADPEWTLHIRTTWAPSLSRDSRHLGPSASLVPVTAYTTRTHYDGIGRVISTDVVHRRLTDGTYELAEASRTQYGTSAAWGTRTLVYSAVAATGTVSANGSIPLNPLQSREGDSYVDAWGQLRSATRVVERAPGGAWARVDHRQLDYDLFGVTGTRSPDPSNDSERVSTSVQRRDGLLRPQITVNEVGERTSRELRFSRTTDGGVLVTHRSQGDGGNVEETVTDGFGMIVAERQYTSWFGSGATLQTTYQRDGLGRMVAVIDPDGQVTRRELDWLGRAKTISRYANATSARPVEKRSFVYDTEGQLALVIDYDADGNEQTTAFARDAATGHVIVKINPATTAVVPGFGDIWSFFGNDSNDNGFGRVVWQCSPLGCVNTTYDGAQRPRRRQHFVWANVDGASMWDSYGVEMDYLLDGSPHKLRFLSSSAELDGTAEAPLIEYKYSDTGDLTDLTDNVPGRPANLLAHFDRTLTGAMRQRSDGSGGVETRAYDRMGRVTDIHVYTFSLGGIWDAWQQSLTYNRQGLVATSRLAPGIETAFAEAATTTFTYDSAGRLRTARGGWGYEVETNYQPGKTRIDKVRETIFGTETLNNYFYEDARFPTALTSIASSAVVQHRLRYRADGALSDYNGAPEEADPFGVAHKVYDVEMLTDTNEQRSHFYDGMGMLFATVEGVFDVRYKRTGSGFERQSIERLATIGGIPFARIDEHGNARFMHRDAQGSVVYSRGDRFAPEARYEFSIYGSLIRQRGESLGNSERRGFQGALADPARPGVWSMGSRDYRPALKMWSNIDPARFNLPAANPHRFNADNPLAYVDLSGLDPIENSNVQSAPQWTCQFGDCSSHHSSRRVIQGPEMHVIGRRELTYEQLMRLPPPRDFPAGPGAVARGMALSIGGGVEAGVQLALRVAANIFRSDVPLTPETPITDAVRERWLADARPPEAERIRATETATTVAQVVEAAPQVLRYGAAGVRALSERARRAIAVRRSLGALSPNLQGQRTLAANLEEAGMAVRENPTGGGVVLTEEEAAAAGSDYFGSRVPVRMQSHDHGCWACFIENAGDALGVTPSAEFYTEAAASMAQNSGRTALEVQANLGRWLPGVRGQIITVDQARAVLPALNNGAQVRGLIGAVRGNHVVTASHGSAQAGAYIMRDSSVYGGQVFATESLGEIGDIFILVAR